MLLNEVTGKGFMGKVKHSLDPKKAQIAQYSMFFVFVVWLFVSLIDCLLVCLFFYFVVVVVFSFLFCFVLFFLVSSQSWWYSCASNFELCSFWRNLRVLQPRYGMILITHITPVFTIIPNCFDPKVREHLILETWH